MNLTPSGVDHHEIPSLLDFILGFFDRRSSKKNVERGRSSRWTRSLVQWPSCWCPTCKTNRSGKSACLTEILIESFCSNLPIKYSLLAELMYFSAGGVKGIITIKIRNLNFVDGTLTIEKTPTETRESRIIPIHLRVMDDLQSWNKQHGLTTDDHVVFTNLKYTQYNKGKKPISIQSVDQFFHKTFVWIGIVACSMHSFRRSRLT